MRLLVISNLYPPEVQGGYEILCAQVVEGLRSKGHSVVVLTSGSKAADPDERTFRRLELTGRFPEPVRPSRWGSLGVHLRNAAITRKVIEDVRPDRIFIWSQLRLTLGGAEAAEQSGIPVSYTFNDEHPAGFLPRVANGSVRSSLGAALDATFPRTTIRSRRIAHTTCISATLKSDLIGRGLQIQNSRVIHQGIPLRSGSLSSSIALADRSSGSSTQASSTSTRASTLSSRPRPCFLAAAASGFRSRSRAMGPLPTRSA